jgi:sugar/nucleoside kinase (ribokinase family)
MPAAYDVVVIGDYYLDLVFSGLPCFPELGREIVGSGFEMLPGGAYNTALAMHRLGLKVGWAADFGNDEFSHFAVERARAEGMSDELFAHHARSYRRVTVSISYPHERAFVTYHDPEAEVPAGFRALGAVTARAVCWPGMFYGSVLEAALPIARAKGMKLIMDGNAPEEPTLVVPAVRTAVSSADLFLANAREACRMTGAGNVVHALRTLNELCPLVVVKDGKHGACGCARGEIVHSPAIPVAPLDTTGAGDCFNAGFVRAWLDGRSLEECLRWGNIVGGLSTLAHGGTGQVIRTEDVRQWLAHETEEQTGQGE